MNKLTKVLSIFVIAGVIGTGVAGVAGCKKHKHTYETTYTSYEEEGHAHKATCHPEIHDTLKPHADSDNDGLCDDCNYSMGGSQQATVSSVTISGATTGTVGTAVTLTASVQGSAGVAQTVTWEITEGSGIANIANGVLTATAAGTVTVKATSTVDNTKYGEHTVVFSAAVDPGATVESVTISGATEGKVGTPVTLTASVQGSAGVAQTVTWEITEGSDIATIENGVLTATAAGTVKVVATSTADTTKSSEAHTVVFTAAEKTLYDELCEREDKLYSNDFETAADRLPDFGGDFGISKGVYTDFAVNKSSAGATKDTHYVKVEGGKAVQVNPGAGTTYTVVDFGGVKGVLEGYVEVTLSEAANSMTFIQFVGDSAAKTNSEVFGLRTDGGDVKYRLDGGSVVGAPTAIKTVTEMKVYFKYDQATKKMTVKIGGAVLCEELETTISKLTGFRLASGDSNTRTVNADNLVFCGTALTIADYREEKLAALTAAYNAYDSTLYSADRYAQITAAKETAETAIGAAETMSGVLTAYNTAIAAMKAVPTIEGEGLYLAKEALKAEVEEAYGASKYTYNAEEHAAAYAKIIAAIDAYSGEVGENSETNPTGIYADKSIIAAVTALTENVKNDEDVIGEAKTAAVKALQEIKGGSENFITNKTEYETALTTHSNNIENIQLGANVDKAAVEATLAQIAQAQEAGEAAINAIKTDAELLEDAKEAALKEIAEYKLDEVDALAPDGGITQEQIDQVKNDILTTRNLRSNAVKTAASIEAVNDEVAEAKTNIDSYLASLVETLEQIRTRELQTLKDEYDKIIADIEDEVVLKILQEDYNGYVGRINGVTDEADKSRVAEIRVEGVNLMRVRVARRTAYVEIAEYAAEVKGTIYNDAAKAAIDDEIRYDINTLTDQSKWSEDMWVIHNASTIAGVDDAKQTVIDAIDNIVAELKASEISIKIVVDGEEFGEAKVVYANALTVSAIDVSSIADNKTIAGGKWYTNDACTAEYDFDAVVYNGFTLYAKLANATKVVRNEEFSYAAITGFTTDQTVITNEDLTGVNSFLSIYNEDLLNVKWRSGKDKNLNYIQIDGEGLLVTFTGAGTLTLNIRSTGDSNNSTIALKDLATGKYISAKGSDITAYDNNVYAVEAKSKYVTITFEVIEAGSYLLCSNLTPTSGGDAVSKTYASITRISAISLVDTYKLEHDVTVTWGDGEAKTYHHSEEITPPEAPAGNGEFVGWYMNGEKFEGGSLTAGTYTFEAKYEYTVKITYNNGVEDVDLYLNVTDGSAIEALLPTLNAKTEGDKVFLHSGWTLDGDDVDFATLSVGTADSPVAYTLVAKYEEAEIKLVTDITVSAADEKTEISVGDTLQLTATTNDDADDKTVTWSSSDESVATVDENGVVTAVGEGPVTITATAKDGSGVTGTIELTVLAAKFESWSYDFVATKPDGSNITLKDGDVLVPDALIVKTSSNSNRNKGGYLTAKEGCVIELHVEADAVLTYVCANSNSARSLSIKNEEGEEIHKQTMDNSKHTVNLTKGVYTITFAGGECRLGSIALTY